MKSFVTIILWFRTHKFVIHNFVIHTFVIHDKLKWLKDNDKLEAAL